MGNNIGKGLATIGVCAAGAFCMWVTKDSGYPTGIGWAIFGTYLVWAM